MTNYEFYLKCQENGITDQKTKADIARICLIAENNGIIADEEECVKMFKFGKDDLNKQKKLKAERNKQAKLDKQKNTEKEQLSEAIKISELFGRDKPIYFYQKEIDNLNASISLIESIIRRNDNLTTSMVKAYSVKEKDWAVHGGIASGIAGGAAGVATALDIQQQNAKIREHNDEVISSAAQIGFNLNKGHYGEISKLKNKIKSLNTRIDSFKKILVEELPEINLLEKLNPQIIQNKTTISGALKITVQINAVELFIYDNVKATVDGSFKALLIDDNGNISDEVYFYIPSKYGAASEHKITGYSSKRIYNDTISYKIVFIPINLWAIETDQKIKSSEDRVILENKKEIVKFWKQDIVNQQKNIPNDLKVKTDEIKNKKQPIDKFRRFAPYCAIILGIEGVICLFAGTATGLFVICLSILLIFGANKSKQIEVKEKENQIQTLETQARNKENLLNKKIKEIENIFN